jgi:hypothetical protein
MNQPVEPTRCERLDQLIVDAEVRISRLTLLLAELTERGHETSRAEDLVSKFEELIGTWNEWRLKLPIEAARRHYVTDTLASSPISIEPASRSLVRRRSFSATAGA